MTLTATLEPALGELGLAASDVSEVPLGGELLEHPRDRGRRDPEVGRQAGRGYARPLAVEPVDRLEILLGRLVEVRVAGHS